MKKPILKKILFICMITHLMGGTSYAAQEGRSAAWWRKTKELRACQKAKNCTEAQLLEIKKRRRRRIAAGVTAGVVAVGAAAKVVADAWPAESGPGGFEYTSRESIPNIQTVVQPFGVRFAVNDKPQNMFLLAAYNAGLDTVKRYADLVRRNVLSAGLAVSTAMLNHFKKVQDMQKGNAFVPIVEYLEKAVRQFNPAQQASNELLLYQVQGGVLAKVKELYCHKVRPTPSKNAVSVAREVAEHEGKGRIADYLRNPVCSQ